MVNATNNDLYHNSLVKDSPNIGNTSGAMELSNNTSALIDKIHIKNIVVTDVKDIYSLRDRDILIVKEGKNNYLFNERGEGYSSISISDAKNFDKFDYYLTRWGHISSNLQISIDDSKYQNLNCYSIEDYKDRLVAIQEELLCNYGISVSFENAEIEYIEINKTIVLNTFYEDYLRILELLVSLFPRRLRLRTNGEFEKFTKKGRLTEIEKLTETYSRSSGKSGISIEIYNKTDEMYERYNITLMYNYLRFEIKLKSSDKIKKELGTNVLQTIRTQKRSG